MSATLSAAAGTFVGVASCLPSAMLFERALKGSRAPSVAIGLVSMVVSFAMLVGALVSFGSSRKRVCSCLGVQRLPRS